MSSTKCWCIFVCRLLILGNKRIMQPINKVTCHRSETKSSRRIRHVHEDLWAHQSYQTNLRQALTHIYDIRVHLAAFRPKTGPNGPSPWSADHHGRPIMWWWPTGPTDSHMTRASVWLVLHGGLAQFTGKRLLVPSYKYKGRGFK